MAATVDINTVEKEVITLRATGDERVGYLKKYPVVPYEDSFLLKLYRKAINSITPVLLAANTQYVLNHEEGSIEYLIEFDEDDQIYILEYEYETIYYDYLTSLRDTLGDYNFNNLRYTTATLISYLHKALFEKVVPMSNWTFTLDTDVNRVEEAIDKTQLGFIVDFAALIVQKAELRRAFNRAIVIADRNSKLDTTKHLKAMQDQVKHDEATLVKDFNDYLINTAFSAGSLRLAIKDSIKARADYLYEGSLLMTPLEV